MTTKAKRDASIAAGRGDPDAPAPRRPAPLDFRVDPARTSEAAAPAPALDAEGKLAEWPPAATLYQSNRYDASRPSWLVLQNALSSCPYSSGLGTPLRHGQTVDEAFLALAGWVGRLAASLRHTTKMNEEAQTTLRKYRGVLLAELDREEILAELREARARPTNGS